MRICCYYCGQSNTYKKNGFCIKYACEYQLKLERTKYKEYILNLVINGK